ncbi:MAG TPA: phosphotransferase, partial [Thermoanaerobaculia bacterium]|nr:phosphotransferase [Thermoanaerobaculia bacterium]
MNFTAELVLRSDVLLVPCEELSDDVRGRISFNAGDYTLSHRHGRTLAQVIDGDTASLLALFRRPRTIVEAVVENSRALGKDPEAWLDELLPYLGAFVQKRVLVPAGSEDELEVRPRFESGAAVAGWKIVRCASLIEDSEIYQLRKGSEVAALKVARSSSPHVRTLLGNEEAVLRHLDGSGIAPRLLDAGTVEERPYLILEWVAGVDAATAAAQRRHDRASLIELCASIAAAYAALHERGVLHADVHPRNIIAGEQTMLLDFGYAVIDGQPPRTARGGLFAYFEPEFLAELRQGRDAPATPSGEQAMLAAMLYFLIAGKHHLDFSYDRTEMARQGEEDPPRTFAECGVPPWPEVERILVRALEKDPARRHASMADMAAQLAQARDNTVRESLATPVSAEAHALLETTLQSFARGGERYVEGFPIAPRATINYGCAGAAVGLLRIAETRGDAALLALADVWRSRAVALIGPDESYYNPDFELPRSVLGDVTPYHTEAGIHA